MGGGIVSLNFELLWHFRELFDGNGNEKGEEDWLCKYLTLSIGSTATFGILMSKMESMP